MRRMMLCPAGCCCAQQDYATSAFGRTLPSGFWQQEQLPGSPRVGGAAQAGLAVSRHLGQRRAFALLCTSSSSSCNLHFKASPVLPVSPDRPRAATGARGQGEGHSQPSQAQIPARDKPDPRARHGGGSSCSRRVVGEGEGEIGFRGSKCSSPEWMYIFIIH